MSVVTALRQATADRHEALHEHPVITRLLSQPDRDAYTEFLEAFAGFYAACEPALVAGAQEAGRLALYPAPIRCDALRADLGQEIYPSVDAPAPRTPAGLAGLLYVVNGSALGGKTILSEIRPHLPERTSFKYLGLYRTAASAWFETLGFCEEVGAGSRETPEAIRAARAAFDTIALALDRQEAIASNPTP